MSGLSQEQIRYLHDVLGLRGVVLSEAAAQAAAIAPNAAIAAIAAIAANANVEPVAPAAPVSEEPVQAKSESAPPPVVRPVPPVQVKAQGEPRVELHQQGVGRRLVALFGQASNRGRLTDQERDLAHKMIQAMKISLKDVLTIEWDVNVGSAAADEIERVLNQHPANTLIIFGETAARALFGSVNPGTWQNWTGRRAMVTLSPVELLQYPDRKKIAWAHLQMVMKEL